MAGERDGERVGERCWKSGKEGRLMRREVEEEKGGKGSGRME